MELLKLHQNQSQDSHAIRIFLLLPHLLMRFQVNPLLVHPLHTSQEWDGHLSFMNVFWMLSISLMGLKVSKLCHLFHRRSRLCSFHWRTLLWYILGSNHLIIWTIANTSRGTFDIVIYVYSLLYDVSWIPLKCRGYSKGGVKAYERWRFDNLACEKPPTGIQSILSLNLFIQSELVSFELNCACFNCIDFYLLLTFFSFQKYRLAKYFPEKKEGNEFIMQRSHVYHCQHHHYQHHHYQIFFRNN